MNAEQTKTLESLANLAELRDLAEREWRARVVQVNKMLAKGEKQGIPLPELARKAGVSRQYLHKRKAQANGERLAADMATLGDKAAAS